MDDTRFYYINLDRDVGRRMLMESNAARLSRSFERVPAVDASAISANPPAGFSPGKLFGERWSLRPLEIAVFESHRKAWNTFLTSGASFGIILEDDILFSADFSARIAEAYECIEYFDILKLNHSTQPRRLGRQISSVKKLEMRRVLQTISDAGCYGVTRTGAQALLRQSESYCTHLDDFLFSPERKLRTFQLLPPICAQIIHMTREEDYGIEGSSRISCADDVAKGPSYFRTLREVRRLLRKFKLALTVVNGSKIVDMRKYVVDFKPVHLPKSEGK